MLFKKRVSREALAEQVLNIAQGVMQERGIVADPSLEAPLNEEGLGLDSMGRLELLRAVERGFQVDIPEKYWGVAVLQDLQSLVIIISKLGPTLPPVQYQKS